MADIGKIAAGLISGGESFALATVLKSSGSTPRGAGVSMLVLQDGRTAGTVGGGGLEGSVILTAREVIASKAPRTLHFTLDGTDAAAAGAVCGGEAEVLVEYIDAAVCDPGRFDAAAGDPSGAAYIFGAGHCGRSLAHILSTLDFRTVVIDDREEFCNAANIPDADRLLVPASMEAVFDELPVDGDSYVVIVTRGHAHDEVVLRRALRTGAGYIGMIGSRGKRETIYRRLLSDGYTQADIDRVSSPIGLPIGAESPEEIAVSIAAELIRARAEKRAKA